jgi:hypothetical protein
MEQFKFDPCLFVGTKVICVVYVDNIIFWSKNTEDINCSAMQMRKLGVDVDRMTTPQGFLESRWNGTQKQVFLK